MPDDARFCGDRAPQKEKARHLDVVRLERAGPKWACVGMGLSKWT